MTWARRLDSITINFNVMSFDICRLRNCSATDTSYCQRHRVQIANCVRENTLQDCFVVRLCSRLLSSQGLSITRSVTHARSNAACRAARLCSAARRAAKSTGIVEGSAIRGGALGLRLVLEQDYDTACRAHVYTATKARSRNGASIHATHSSRYFHVSSFGNSTGFAACRLAGCKRRTPSRLIASYEHQISIADETILLIQRAHGPLYSRRCCLGWASATRLQICRLGGAGRTSILSD